MTSSSPYIFPRSITFFLIDDLGDEDYMITCHHEEFPEILDQAIEGLGREHAPRKYKLSRIERDD